MTITLRRLHPVAASLAATLALAACAQAGPGVGGASPTPGATASPQTVRALQTCFGAATAGWSGAQRASLPTTQLDVQVVAPSGDRAYGSYRTTAGEQGIVAVDLSSGALTRLVAGLGGLAVAPPWLAWVEHTGQINPGPWALRARNLDTGEQLTLATSRLANGTDGLPYPGGLALHGTELAWVQATSIDLRARADELRVYDLAAHKQSVLDTGVLGTPVLAGPYLVWTHGGGDGAVLQAVDASTLLPAALPARLRAQTGVLELAGSPAYLFWNTDAHHGTAWRIDRDRLTTYTVDEAHRLQFFSVAGHFLLWEVGTPGAIVMDLDTGGGYVIPSNGLAGSDAAIVRTGPLGASNPKSGSPGTTVSVLATSSAPAIPGCGD